MPSWNASCSICRNLNPAALQESIFIDLHDNKDFEESAKNKCLSCSIIWRAIFAYIGSTTYFPRLELTIPDPKTYGTHTAGSLNARVYRTKWSDWEPNEERSLWDSTTGGYLELLVYTLEGEPPAPWEAIKPCREPELDSTSDIVVSRVRNWISTCISSHTMCRLDRGNHPPPLPTRVIFVGDDTRRPCLVETGGSLYGHYTALTWRWGDYQPLKTTTSSLEKHRHLLDEDSLPPLFRDALSLTRRLGTPYLWIDALCIIQDSPSDWASEAARMADVYNNAILTIAADSCENATHGLGGLGDHPILLQHKSRLESEGRLAGQWVETQNTPGKRLKTLLRSEISVPCPSPDGGLCNVRVRIMDYTTSLAYHGRTFVPASTISDRAWCLQENLLSRRILHFGTTEVSFQCLEMSACECMTEPRGIEEFEATSQRSSMKKSLLLGDSATTSSMNDTWMDIIEMYTYHKLTKSSDRLPAIAGVAAQMLQHIDPLSSLASLGNNYFAGIWRQHLSSQIAWHVKPPSMRFTPLQFQCQRQLDPIPTWSWGGVTGAVQFARWVRFDVEGILNRSNTVPHPVQVKPGHVSLGLSGGAGIVIRGKLERSILLNPLGITSHPTASWNWVEGTVVMYHGRGPGTPVAFFDAWTSGQAWNREDDAVIYALTARGSRQWALLLKKAPIQEQGLETFLRIGALYPPDMNRLQSQTAIEFEDRLERMAEEDGQPDEYNDRVLVI